jgi:hypothetical protein
LQSRERKGKKIEEGRNKEGMNGHKTKERINDEREDLRSKKEEKYREIEGKKRQRKSKR